MTEEQPKTYRVEDIFEEIPGDSENVVMNLPPEVMERAGIKVGDTVKIRITERGDLSIEKAKDGEE